MTEEYTLPIDLPPTDDDLFGMTTCGNPDCVRPPFPTSQAVVDGDEHFCSAACADYYREVYLVRRAGW